MKIVITTALNLIYLELQKLQIDAHIRPLAPTPEQPQTRHHSQSPSQSATLPPMAHALGTGTGTDSRHVSPVHHSHHSSHPSSSMGTPASSAPASMLPGYTFPQPQSQTGFDIPPSSSSHHNPHHPYHHHHQSSTGGLPAMAATHLLGGMPNAVMAFDNPASYEITPEVFEAFSYAEPITTNMTPAFASGWVRPG